MCKFSLSTFVAGSIVAYSMIGGFLSGDETLISAGTFITAQDQDDYYDEDCDGNGCGICPYYEDEDVDTEWYDDDTWPGRREDSWFRDLER